MCSSPAQQHLTSVLFLFHILGLGRSTSTHLEWTPKAPLGQRSWCSLWQPLSHLDQDPRIKRDCTTQSPEMQTLSPCLGSRELPAHVTEHPGWRHILRGRKCLRTLWHCSKRLSVRNPFFFVAEGTYSNICFSWQRAGKIYKEDSKNSSSRDNYFLHFDVYYFTLKKFIYTHTHLSSLPK